MAAHAPSPDSERLRLAELLAGLSLVADAGMGPGARRDPRAVRRLPRDPDDFRVEIRHQVSEGDLVITHKLICGRHAGPFMGIEPTGRDVRVGCMDVVRIEDDRIIEHWNVVDLSASSRSSARTPRRSRPRSGDVVRAA